MTTYALARPVASRPRRRSRSAARPASRRRAPLRRPRLTEATVDAFGSLWFSPSQIARRVARLQRLRRLAPSTTPRPRPRRRPARPPRPAEGARSVGGELLTRLSRGADDGHEPSHPEVAGGAARRPDLGVALRPQRGRTVSTRCSRSWSSPTGSCPAARRRPEPTPEPPASRAAKPSRRGRPMSSGPGAAPARSFLTAAPRPPPRRRRRRGQALEGRLRARSSTSCSPCSTRARSTAAGRLLAAEGLTRDGFLQGADDRSGATSG